MMRVIIALGLQRPAGAGGPQPAGKNARKRMDCRVKPGNDEKNDGVD